MDINDCISILNQRKLTSPCNDCKPSFLPKSTYRNNQHDLSNLTKHKLLILFVTLQQDRIELYSQFSDALKVLIDESRLSEYPTLVAEVTSRFSVISQHIIQIKDELMKRNEKLMNKCITTIQNYEKEKLTLVASVHLDTIQRSMPSLIQTEGCQLTHNSSYAQDRIRHIEICIGESMEEIQAELVDTVEEEEEEE